MDPIERATRKFQKELNAGVGSLLLLGVIARSRVPMYGYEISRHLEEVYGAPLPMQQGALYPVLRALEAQGLLASEVEPSVSGPPRRYYGVTAAGRAMLKEWKRLWGRTRDLVESVLEGGPRATRRRTLSRAPRSRAAKDARPAPRRGAG